MRKLLLPVVFALSTTFLFAQDGYWSPVNEAALGQNLFTGRTRPIVYKIFQLQENNFVNAAILAPSEKTTRPDQSGTIISFPDAEGMLQRFRIVDAPVLHPDLAARYPGIFSFAGTGVDDPTLSVRFAISQLGVQAMILSQKKSTVYINSLEPTGKYYMVVSRNALGGTDRFQCLTEDLTVPQGRIDNNTVMAKNADDGKLRTYDLALCASGEYSQSWLNGTETSDAERKSKVLAALNNAMTRTNGIYERDFGLRMVLVANNDAVIFLNAASDPFTSSASWNNQSQSTCDTYIGNANYDIGHSITYQAYPGNGNAGCIGCVCTSSTKGRGWTAYYDFASDYFVVDFLTHEMGHQFGGNHTFAFSNQSNPVQAEPGSGSTIMGYAGITDWDVQPHSDDYFHSLSIQQITNYIKSASSSCDVEAATGNAIPTVNAGADFTIPRSTPFTVIGSATDADAGDVLSYCWEQIDDITTASVGFPNSSQTQGPNFRSYLPSSHSSRTIPVLSSILGGTNGNTFEVLPSVARTLNFRLTVRDNRTGGGANQSDDMVVTVSGTTGPFAVTAPNSAVTWGGGTNQTVTWSVNGTNGTPVNCTNVNILISHDGGTTFNILIAGTANDGSELVTVPNVTGSSNRIKIEAVGNIFFDISNTNFTIGTPPACADPTGLNETSITSNSATLNWSSVAGALNYDVQYKAASSGTWLNAATGTTSLTVNLGSLTASTLYDWRVRANCSGGSGNYVQDQFTTSAAGGACPGIYDVSTNGTTGGSATIPMNTDIWGTISPRNDNDYYRLIISNSGSVIISLTTLPANYELALLNSGGSVLVSSTSNGTANETINTTLSPATYFIRVYPKGNANNASSCYTLRVTGTASRGGDGNLITSGLLNIFPNPAGNKLSVSIDDLQSLATIQVYNVSGKLVMQQQTNKPITEMNIAKLPAGIYMLNINDGSKLRSVKFVKE